MLCPFYTFPSSHFGFIANFHCFMMINFFPIAPFAIPLCSDPFYLPISFYFQLSPLVSEYLRFSIKNSCTKLDKKKEESHSLIVLLFPCDSVSFRCDSPSSQLVSIAFNTLRLRFTHLLRSTFDFIVSFTSHPFLSIQKAALCCKPHESHSIA